jgi:hypothetical protein
MTTATAEEYKVDRSDWPPGPWDSEPDRIEWRTKRGFVGLMVRNPLAGAWCGYVAVPPGHPLHGKDYEKIDVLAHGGLTYAGACSGHICHVPQPGEPDNVWWLGFDCNHADDRSPAMEQFCLRMQPSRTAPGEYRDVEYVRFMVEVLAIQVAEAT